MARIGFHSHPLFVSVQWFCYGIKMEKCQERRICKKIRRNSRKIQKKLDRGRCATNCWNIQGV
jgi:hypothetical protein